MLIIKGLYTMQHQQRLINEIEEVKLTILNLLSQSAHLSHQHLLSLLTQTANAEWLDLAAQKLGPEYDEYIQRMTTLEAAVSQIEIGQYGYCCDCEEPITTTLLELDPATQRCEQCAK